jgi:hypothetical protein
VGDLGGTGCPWVTWSLSFLPRLRQAHLPTLLNPEMLLYLERKRRASSGCSHLLGRNGSCGM